MGIIEEKQANKSKILQWLTEDDSPEIGIATKEPLGDYIKGVQSEFKRIEWPTKEQVSQEFVAVIMIVAIIAGLIYVIDLGLNRFIGYLTGL